ncbi:crotonase/enoyl-CoA hydratase family protein [Ferrimonas marina]|uniref:Enoyl-CoA hydratase/carnithine racemase n=1 Tax=Ferrimonas marina TaxID=299255 RepID=A0A1M5X531_9GAMM|nr:crotonase/enoyl-CoA hydratase family protein [Ferrimonas marina]SHH94970.1 Enoyl-CoA hydratase/carnithine racemase [Ferrimonas marina]
MSQRVSWQLKNGVAYVELNRPDKHNALDFEMFKAIVSVQKQLARQRSLRGVILSGAGEDFCSGLDIKSLMGNARQAARLLWKWWPGQANLAQRVCTGWRDLPVPVMAVLHGRVWGGGLQIALGADFRFCHPDADLSVMEARWGLLPDMGGNLAVREQLAQDQALWLVMSGEQIGADKALELGLVTGLDSDPLALAQRKMTTLLRCSPDALAASKRLYRRHGVPHNGAMLGAETLSQIRLLMGRNQRVATAKARGKEREYQPRGRW